MGKGNDVTMWNDTLHFQLLYVKPLKMFSDSDTKLDKTGTFWVSKFHFLYLNFSWPRVKHENDYHHRIPRPIWTVKHVSYHTLRHVRHSCYVFMQWPHLNWPDPDLHLCLCISRLLIWHPRDFFTSLAEFGLATVPGLVSAAESGKSRLWHLAWRWPDIWPF